MLNKLRLNAQIPENDNRRQARFVGHQRMHLTNAFSSNDAHNLRRAIVKYSKTNEPKETQLFDPMPNGVSVDPIFDEVHRRMNNPVMLANVQKLMGIPVASCGFYVVKFVEDSFRARFFIEKHSVQKVTFVVNLSPGWREGWGGQVQFLADDGRIEDTYPSSFNSISLFKFLPSYRITPIVKGSNNCLLTLVGWYAA